MSGKILGKAPFSGPSSSILVLTDERELRRLAESPATRSRPGRELRVGLTIGGPNKHQRDSYIAAPVSLILAILGGTNRVSRHIALVVPLVREQIGAMESLVDQNDHEFAQRFSPAKLFPYVVRGGYSAEEVWSALVIARTLRDQPEDYWSGRDSLWKSFLRYLGFHLEQAGGMSPTRLPAAYPVWLETRLFGGGKTLLFHELGAWIELDDDYREKMRVLGTLSDLYEGYAKIWMTLIFLLVGAGAPIWIRLAAEVLDGLAGLAAEFEKALRDGVIEETEEGGIWIAGVFAFLPFSSLLRGSLQRAADFLNLGILLAILGLIITTITRELIHTLGKLERQAAARETGFARIDEQALDQWIVIERVD